MSAVMQRNGLAMDVAGLWVSECVQADMVKTHMATGRHTPPPQQHLLWLTIHSGKRRRFIVYTNQKKQPLFRTQEILQRCSCTFVRGALQTTSLMCDPHICTDDCQSQRTTEAARQVPPAALHRVSAQSEQVVIKRSKVMRLGCWQKTVYTVLKVRGRLWWWWTWLIVWHFDLRSAFPTSASVWCGWLFPHHKWNMLFSVSPPSFVSHSSGQQKYQWWRQRWGWGQWWWPWRRKAGRRSPGQQKGAPVKAKHKRPVNTDAL